MQTRSDKMVDKMVEGAFVGGIAGGLLASTPHVMTYSQICLSKQKPLMNQFGVVLTCTVVGALAGSVAFGISAFTDDMIDDSHFQKHDDENDNLTFMNAIEKQLDVTEENWIDDLVNKGCDAFVSKLFCISGSVHAFFKPSVSTDDEQHSQQLDNKQVDNRRPGYTCLGE